MEIPIGVMLRQRDEKVAAEKKARLEQEFYTSMMDCAKNLVHDGLFNRYLFHDIDIDVNKFGRPWKLESVISRLKSEGIVVVFHEVSEDDYGLTVTLVEGSKWHDEVVTKRKQSYDTLVERVCEVALASAPGSFSVKTKIVDEVELVVRDEAFKTLLWTHCLKVKPSHDYDDGDDDDTYVVSWCDSSMPTIA